MRSKLALPSICLDQVVGMGAKFFTRSQSSFLLTIFKAKAIVVDIIADNYWVGEKGTFQQSCSDVTMT